MSPYRSSVTDSKDPFVPIVINRTGLTRIEGGGMVGKGEDGMEMGGVKLNCL